MNKNYIILAIFLFEPDWALGIRSPNPEHPPHPKKSQTKNLIIPEIHTFSVGWDFKRNSHGFSHFSSQKKSKEKNIENLDFFFVWKKYLQNFILKTIFEKLYFGENICKKPVYLKKNTQIPGIFFYLVECFVRDFRDDARDAVIGLSKPTPAQTRWPCILFDLSCSIVKCQFLYNTFGD